MLVFDGDTGEALGAFCSVANPSGIVFSQDVEPCLGDYNQDSQVDVNDLLAVIAGWGDPYDVDDLLIVIGAWGSCP